MNKKVATSARWYGPVPTRNGKPLPQNQWARAGRRRKWIVRWYAPDGTRPQETFKTKAEADDFASTKANEFRQQGSSARLRPKRIMLGEFVDELLVLRIDRRGKRLSIGTLQEYRTILKRFRDHAGASALLEAVTIADATRYLAGLREALSTASINKHKRILKAAFNTAVVQLGYLHVNPFAKLEQDATADQPIRYITPAEFRAIITTCRTMPDALWWESFVTLCYTAGTRLNEAVHLTWRDVDFEANTVRVIAKAEGAGLAAWRPKDYDSRTIPVPTLLMDLLTRLHTEATEGSNFVFIPPERIAWIRAKREAGTWREGQAVLNNVNKNFQRRALKAGVNDVCVHDLRRSAISHWARKLAVLIVQELAGHADIKTTQRYYVTIRVEDLAEARNVTASVLLSDAK
jgi:integrase